MHRAATSTYLDYSVGDVFAVPLASRGFGIALVAAMRAGKRKSVGHVWLFGFGPRRRIFPTARAVTALRLRDALCYVFQGDRALTTGRWRKFAHINQLSDSGIFAPPHQCSNGRQVLWHNPCLGETDYYDADCLPKRVFGLLPFEHGIGNSSMLEYGLDDALKPAAQSRLNTGKRERAAWCRAIGLLTTAFADPKPTPRLRGRSKPRKK